MYVCMQISKSPQHVAERNRKLSNRALVDFIVARGTDDHIQSIICALAVVEHVSILEAEEKFLRGPVIDASEREHFDSRIKKKQLKKSGKP
ncbi:PWWP domain-containing DNA repair factor 3A-like [Chanodichthys erythropterus]|uniref:PWWP domain-containing DNA repair factor 3A-like n=1 Tax=Chanodichthys erythropterus TaxID=933992 RepID=UPI00351F5741